MSTEDLEKLKKFWIKVGLVIVYTSDDMIIGRIVDISQGYVVMRDIQGLRHWVNPDSISSIMELGENIDRS